VTAPAFERRTAPLRLRRVTHGDVESVVSLSSYPSTHRHSPTGTPTRAEAKAYVRRFAENDAAVRLALAIGLVRRVDLDTDGFITFAG
jgi:hypothetical protein